MEGDHPLVAVHTSDEKVLAWRCGGGVRITLQPPVFVSLASSSEINVQVS